MRKFSSSKDLRVKHFLAALLFVCSSAFAQELDATEAALEVLPAGTYSGTTPQGDACQVKVHADANGVAVVASSGNLMVSRLVLRGTGYRYIPGQRMFLSSDAAENVFRTLAVEVDTQYVVVARKRNGEEVKVECVVNL
jgi:hypothetical protein